MNPLKSVFLMKLKTLRKHILDLSSPALIVLKYYCMSKKSSTSLCSNLLNKLDKDFLDRQYLVFYLSTVYTVWANDELYNKLKFSVVLIFWYDSYYLFYIKCQYVCFKSFTPYTVFHNDKIYLMWWKMSQNYLKWLK